MSEIGDQRVRDAMVSDPPTLDASACAREAGEVLVRPGVKAVLVCDEGMLIGVITRKTLVREVVALGRDPLETTLGLIAERPNATVDPQMPLADAFLFLEQSDFERVPVVEDGRLVGVLSRSSIRRRIAEDGDHDPAE
jgi:CBS domain-containing protein